MSAKQTVPVRWRLADANGVGIDAARTVGRVASVSVSCETGAPHDSVEETTSSSGLRSLGGGRWAYNWATIADWAGTCRELRKTLADGATLTASFRFR